MHGLIHTLRTPCILRTLSVVFLTAGLIGAPTMRSADAAGKSMPIQIGMAKTFVLEKSKGFVDVATDDFKEVMKKSTGLDGEVHFKFAPAEVAEKLVNKQLDFGILHAHEFAWLHAKYPDLQPLMIAANKNYVERAYLVVHKTSSAKTIADLRGKSLDMPLGSKEHCRVFLKKICGDHDPRGVNSFFGSIAKSASQSDALDDVARGKAHATVIDTITLEFYKEIKGPVFAKNLTILQQSEAFPPAVIAYMKGALEEETLNQFRDGLLKAHTTQVGRDMMKTWTIEAFEPIPKDFSKSLAEVLKAYPTPPQ